MSMKGLLAVAWFSIMPIGMASATYSIVACERETMSCGVAIATHSLAVGDGVPFAQTGLGAGVSQFETNPHHAPAIYSALKNGADAKAALQAALRADTKFGDGQGPAFRQIGLVAAGRGAAAHTGSEAGHWAGHRAEGQVSVQGNGLVSDKVLEAMWIRFHDTKGALADRLMTALEAGHAAGGQKIGVMSAALLVSTPDGWPVDIDLRADHATSTAIQDLRRAFNANRARVLLNRARRMAADDVVAARQLAAQALANAPDWDRIWLGAARLAKALGTRMTLAGGSVHFKTSIPYGPGCFQMSSIFPPVNVNSFNQSKDGNFGFRFMRCIQDSNQIGA